MKAASINTPQRHPLAPKASDSKASVSQSAQGKAPASFEEILHYREYKPCAALQPYVECYWQLESDPSDTTQYRKEKVLPYAFPEMIFCYQGTSSIIYNKTTKQELPQSFLMGQFEQYIYLEYQGQLASFGVKFKPAGLYQLLKMPMKDLTNKTIPLPQVVSQVGAT